MPRSLDDDASSRLDNADQEVSGSERLHMQRLRRSIRSNERTLARWKRISRVRRAAAFVAASALAVGLGWTAYAWEEPDRFIAVDVVCGVLILSAAVATAVVLRGSSLMLDKADAEDGLETNREALRFLAAVAHPSLAERRSLYREDVADIVEQYQAESRRYRRVHHSLQSLIMVGSLSTSTVTALNTGPLTWQQVVTIVISFAVAVAAAFTGYFKFRERSFYLQQTADDIEAEANALALQVGEYQQDSPEEALGRFAQRVESLRNEQRRRQQQLDQPTDQAPVTQPPM